MSVKCGKCGGEMSPNPHPQAGKPPYYLEVGTIYECIPCLVLNRHRWAERAMKAESALDADAADLWRVTNAIKKEIAAREEKGRREELERVKSCITFDAELSVYKVDMMKLFYPDSIQVEKEGYSASSGERVNGYTK